jgi:AraC family transcriptional regulator
MQKEDYLQKLQSAMHYIEIHLHQEISLSSVSSVAFSSLSHFHRIFFFMTGVTLKEYIRKRRLSVAAQKLVETNAKVIDIALASGFDTPETFSRAFKSLFGINPTEFRFARNEQPLFEPIDVVKLFQQSLCAGTEPEVNFVLRRLAMVAGVTTKTTLSEHQQTRDIPRFFGEVMQQRLLEAIVDRSTPNQLLGVYTDMSDEEEFTYTVGYEVTSDSQSHGYSIHRLPAGKYARFTVIGPPEELEKAWRYIYGQWLPNSGGERVKGFDFEIYQSDKTEIYIPFVGS